MVITWLASKMISCNSILGDSQAPDLRCRGCIPDGVLWLLFSRDWIEDLRRFSYRTASFYLPVGEMDLPPVVYSPNITPI